MEDGRASSGGRGESRFDRPLVSAVTGCIQGCLNGVMIVFNHDPGSEVNVMTCKVQEQCRLPIDKSPRSEEHTSELQSRRHLVCRLLLENRREQDKYIITYTLWHHAISKLTTNDNYAGHNNIITPLPSERPFVSLSEDSVFFNDTEPAEIYPFPSHAAFPI